MMMQGGGADSLFDAMFETEADSLFLESSPRLCALNSPLQGGFFSTTSPACSPRGGTEQQQRPAGPRQKSDPTLGSALDSPGELSDDYMTPRTSDAYIKEEEEPDSPQSQLHGQVLSLSDDFLTPIDLTFESFLSNFEKDPIDLEMHFSQMQPFADSPSPSSGRPSASPLPSPLPSPRPLGDSTPSRSSSASSSSSTSHHSHHHHHSSSSSPANIPPLPLSTAVSTHSSSSSRSPRSRRPKSPTASSASSSSGGLPCSAPPTIKTEPSSSSSSSSSSERLKRQRTLKEPHEDFWREKFESQEKLVLHQKKTLEEISASLSRIEQLVRSAKEEQRLAILQVTSSGQQQQQQQQQQHHPGGPHLLLAAPQFSRLSEAYDKYLEVVRDAEGKLANLQDAHVLTPSQISELRNLWSQAMQLSSQIVVLREELNEDAPVEALVALVWGTQPFPAVFAKHLRQQLDPNRLTAQLITASSVTLSNISSVSVGVIRDGELLVNDDASPTEGNVQRLNPANNIAAFPIRFINGTNKRVAQMRASVELTIRSPVKFKASETVTVRSPLSDPFIVTVHPKQFADAEGLLLLSFHFKTAPTWPTIANALQYQFLLITRQDFLNPQRPLSPGDLSYIHERFFRRSHTITADQFHEFWTWYGPIIKQIKYARHINALWQAGAILGFFSRTELEYILGTQLPGTFLVRFSERHPGLFATSYMPHVMVTSLRSSQSSSISHFLIQAGELGKDTIPDFLRSRSHWAFLVQYQPRQRSGIPYPYYSAVPKSQVLSQYYSQDDQKSTQPDGYDDIE